MIHHARSASGDIATRIAHEGSVRLDPPGIALDVAGLFLGRGGRRGALTGHTPAPSAARPPRPRFRARTATARVRRP